MWEPKLRTPGMARSSLLPRGHDASLLREGRARLGDPVHQEVPLLERGEQRLAEAGHDRDAGDGEHGRPRRTPGAGRRTIGRRSRS